MSDWEDVEVSHLIMSTTTFIVFIDEVGDIDWCVDNFDWDAIDLVAFNGVINRAAALEAIPWNGIDGRFELAAKRLIAEAIARALDGDPQSGVAMLTEVTKQLELRSNEVSRRWYLTSCYLALIPFLILGAGLWMVRLKALNVLGPTVFWFLIAAVVGALGALFSVIARSGELKFAASSGRELHFFEGTSRIIAGAISGGVTGVAVKSGLILSPLITSANSAGALMIAAVAAGSAERLATSILSSAEGSTAKIVAASHVEPADSPKEGTASASSRQPPNRRRGRRSKCI
jgi:hypothetical protein